MLMYLSDVEEGGETCFPQDSEWANPRCGPLREYATSEGGIACTG